MRHAGQETEQNMGAGYSAVNEKRGKKGTDPVKKAEGTGKDCRRTGAKYAG